jgi:hypothetical protein
VRPLEAGLHGPRDRPRLEPAVPLAPLAGRPRAFRTAAEDDRARGAVELRDRHHDRRFDRQKAALGGGPALERLEFGRLGGDVGDVEAGEDLFAGLRVIVGRPAHEREPGQGDERVDPAAAPLVEEVALDRRPRVEPGGEHRDHREALGLECADHPVVMGAVAGQEVGAQQEEPDRALGTGARQILRALADPPGQPRMVDTDLGIDRGRGDFAAAAQAGARSSGVAVDQEVDEALEVLGRAREPVLHREEIGLQILGLAGDEAEQLGQPAQHRHLPGTRDRPILALAAQPLEQPERTAPTAVHREPAEPGEAGDLGCGEDPQERVELVAARLEVGQDRPEMLLEEEHRGDHDVRPGDRRPAAQEGPRVVRPIRGDVELELEARQRAGEPGPGLHQRGREVIVHRHDHDPHRRLGGEVRRAGRGLSDRNAPWLHRASRG